MPSITSLKEWTNLPVGTIVDTDLKTLFEAGLLINHNYDGKNIKQACYDLRVGDYYFDVLQNDLRIPTPAKGIILKPKQCVVILTKENVNIPADCLARVLTKGKLFSLGLSAVNTYLDPGFVGCIGIVLHNLSNQSIVLEKELAIAKVEFVKLNSPVSNPYRGRPYEDEHTWRIPKEYIINNEQKEQFFDLEEVALSHGKNFYNLFRITLEVQNNVFALMLLCFFLVLIISTTVLFFPNYITIGRQLWSIIISFCVGIIVSFVFYKLSSVKFKNKKQ